MLRCRSAMAKAGVREQLEMERLLSHLKGIGYVPVTRTIFAGACTTLGLPDPGEQVVAKAFTGQESRRFATRPEAGGVVGEMLLNQDTICIVSPFVRDNLRASVVCHGDADASLQKFCQDIELAIRARFDGRRVKGMDFNWKALSPRALYFDRRRYAGEREDTYLPMPGATGAKIQCRDPEYDLDDLECSRLMVDQSIRSFVLTLARLGKMRSKDAAEMAETVPVDRLLSLGLVAQEYLLTCRQDQHTICVMPTRDAVNKEPTASLRCSVCGRGFLAENLQQIYSLAERGRKLLDGSLWMSVWVTELLVENGVSKSAIKWNMESQGEELDVMVEDFDSRAFLELKDREFGLGDAYPFVYRLTRYGGRLGIVATMDKVSPDAKAFLEEDVKRRDFPSQVRSFEGPAEIQAGIATIVTEMSLSQARRLLRPFYDGLGFDLAPVMEARLVSKREDDPSVVAAASFAEGSSES